MLWGIVTRTRLLRQIRSQANHIANPLKFHKAALYDSNTKSQKYLRSWPCSDKITDGHIHRTIFFSRGRLFRVVKNNIRGDVSSGIVRIQPAVSARARKRAGDPFKEIISGTDCTRQLAHCIPLLNAQGGAVPADAT